MAQAYREVHKNALLIFGHGKMEEGQVAQMRKAGIHEDGAFDVLSLNLYPTDIVNPEDLDNESIQVIGREYAKSIKLGRDVGLPVVVGEYGKSSSKLGGERDERE